MFAYGFVTITSSLILYITTEFPFSVSKAYLVYGCYNSLLFTTPLIGGYLGEKLGYTRTIILGPLLCIIGLFLISCHNLICLYFGLACFITGVCYFVPTLFVIVGKLYKKTDFRRDSGFTLQYIIFNMGCFIGTLNSSFLHQQLGYRAMFIVATLINAIGLIFYFSIKHKIIPERGRVVSATYHGSNLSCWTFLTLIAAVIMLVCAAILSHPIKYNYLLFTLTIVITIAIAIHARQRSAMARKKLFALLMLSYFSIGFWSLYSLEPSLLTIFIKNNVDRLIGDYLIPAQSFYALDPIFIIIFGFALSALWLYLGKRNKEPSLPFKFFLSLILMAAGFLLLVFSIHFLPQSKMSPWVIVFCYMFLAIAELCISPIGNAMVGRLSPEGMEGRLMGVWQLFTGVSAALSGLLAQMALIPKKNTPIPTANLIYQNAFLKIGISTFVIALVVFMLIPYLKSMIYQTQKTKELAD